MDLLFALLAFAFAYLAYFNFIIIKRVRAGALAAVSQHLLVQSVIALVAYSAGTCLFVIAAIASSMAVFAVGIFAVLVAAVSSLVFRVVRPRQ